MSGVNLPLDEVFDTQMEVERNPFAAWMAIKTLAEENRKLRADLKALSIPGTNHV